MYLLISIIEMGTGTFQSTNQDTLFPRQCWKPATRSLIFPNGVFFLIIHSPVKWLDFIFQFIITVYLCLLQTQSKLWVLPNWIIYSPVISWVNFAGVLSYWGFKFFLISPWISDPLNWFHTIHRILKYKQSTFKEISRMFSIMSINCKNPMAEVFHCVILTGEYFQCGLLHQKIFHMKPL